MKNIEIEDKIILKTVFNLFLKYISSPTERLFQTFISDTEKNLLKSNISLKQTKSTKYIFLL
jgi:hypothetical protein